MAARNWFAQVVPATAKPVALDWAKSHTLDGWLLIPLADTTSPFAAEHKHAYRYLLAQNTTGNAFTGRIVEVVLEGKTPTASNVEQAVLAATRRLLAAPQAPGPLPNITGLLLFYSPAYHYETGYVYEKGQPLAERVRLLRSPQKTTAAPLPTKGASPQATIDNESDCIMELRCGYVNGELSNCIYVAHCVAGSGGGGEGGWSGDGGGGGGGGGGSSVPGLPPTKTMPPQITPGTCVPSSLTQVKMALCNVGGQTEGQVEGAMWTYGMQLYGMNFMNDGVPLNGMTNFVDHFFTTTILTPATNYQSAIASGHPIMVDIFGYMDGPNTAVYHSVIITGYDLANPSQVYYLDPATGTTKTGNGPDIIAKSHYVIPVTGCK